MRTYAEWAEWYFLAARLYRRTFGRNKTVIVVVGSFGKTTTTRAIKRMLGIKLEENEKNYNYLGLIAWSLLRTPWSQRYAVLEVGIKHRGQMRKFVEPLNPDVVVVTCIGDEHIFSFGTREGIREEKANAVRLLRPGGVAILNGDDPNVRWMATQTRARVAWYGFDETTVGCRGLDWSRNWPDDSVLKFAIDGFSGELKSEFVAQESSHSLLAALATSHVLGYPIEASVGNLDGMQPTPGRMQRLRTPRGVWIFRDDFKSTLATIHLACDVMRKLPGRLFIVLGGVDAPVGNHAIIYRKLASELSQVFDEVILVKGTWRDDFSPEFRRQVKSTARLQFFERVKSVSGATDILRERAGEGDVVLIEGRTQEALGRVAGELMEAKVLPGEKKTPAS